MDTIYKEEFFSIYKCPVWVGMSSGMRTKSGAKKHNIYFLLSFKSQNSFNLF